VARGEIPDLVYFSLYLARSNNIKVGFLTASGGLFLIALLQRVLQAKVEVDDQTVGAIGSGLMVLLAVEPSDTTVDAEGCIDRLLRYRVFADAEGRMNLSLLDQGGSLLLVPQFTLAADTRKGLRPSFSSAAPPQVGESLFEDAVDAARRHIGAERVATGRFGAHMRVSLTNDGPVTFWLQHPARPAST
jgi:D-tyrosyl-tRNA(Tyr) deacylase